MVYKQQDLEKQALAAIKKHSLVFIDEVVTFLPCSRSTFYGKGLDKLDSIKAAIEERKVNLKAGLRKKWYSNDNATTQIALYKLIGTEDESDRLNGKQKLEHSGPNGGPIQTEEVRSIEPGE